MTAKKEAPAAAPVEQTVEEASAPAPQPAAPQPKPKAAGQGGWEGTPDEIHRKYFVPPAGYQKPKFPTSF